MRACVAGGGLWTAPSRPWTPSHSRVWLPAATGARLEPPRALLTRVEGRKRSHAPPHRVGARILATSGAARPKTRPHLAMMQRLTLAATAFPKHPTAAVAPMHIVNERDRPPWAPACRGGELEGGTRPSNTTPKMGHFWAPTCPWAKRLNRPQNTCRAVYQPLVRRSRTRCRAPTGSRTWCTWLRLRGGVG